MRIFKRNFDIIATFVFIFLMIVLTAANVLPQSSTQISRKCPGASPSPARTKVEIEKDGDINVVNCSTKQTAITGTVSVTGTASFTGTLDIPSITRSGILAATFATDASVILGDQSVSSNGVVLTVSNLNSPFGGIIAATNGQNFTAGDIGGGNSTQINVVDSSTLIRLRAAGAVDIGDTAAASSSTVLKVDAANSKFDFLGGSGNGNTVDFDASKQFLLKRTITAGGTTGNQTINDRPAGTVNFAAATAAITVTNNTVTTSSIIIITARTNDATCLVKNYVPAAGSFVINMTANCTAETSVGFIITN
jgi:hypothetical protein